jgi:DNA-binding NarL/FixJ family response regulator
MKSRILIVDDDERVRDALSLYLDTYDEFEVVGKAADGAEAVRLSERLGPDLVLMDLRMPVMDGVTATRKIRERLPNTTVVALTNSWDGGQLEAARQAGASACVSKGANVEQLTRVLKKAGRKLRLPPFYLRLRANSSGHEDRAG